MQPREEKSMMELPALKIAKDTQIQNDSNSMKKVDISRMESAPKDSTSRNERIVYMRPEEQSNQRTNPISAQTAQNMQRDDSKRSEADAILQAAQANSFFSGIIDHLQKENELLQDKKYVKSDLLTKNLLAEMKNHWQSKKEEIKLDIKSKEMQEKILSKIDELRLLEAEWQSKEIMIEETKKQLDFIEKVIEEKGYELKKVVKTAKYSETAKNPFILKNGKAIKSINELLEVLKLLDKSVFNEHVNEMRNDFSQWIQNEFRDDALAGRVKDAYSRDDLIAILEMF